MFGVLFVNPEGVHESQPRVEATLGSWFLISNATLKELVRLSVAAFSPTPLGLKIISAPLIPGLKQPWAETREPLRGNNQNTKHKTQEQSTKNQSTKLTTDH
jgi:hypothetical protein